MFDPEEYERQRKIVWETTGIDSDYWSCLWHLAFRMKLVESPPIPLTVEEMCGGLLNLYWVDRYNPGRINEVMALLIPHLETLPYRYYSVSDPLDIEVSRRLFVLCFYTGHWMREELRCRLASLLEKWCADVPAPEPEHEERWRAAVRTTDRSSLIWVYPSDEFYEMEVDGESWWLLIRELRSSPYLPEHQGEMDRPESPSAQQNPAHEAQKKGAGEE